MALLVVVLAAAVRAYGLGWALPEVYEEATPLRKAWEMWGWGPSASLDLNPHFFNYPSLAIYIQFIGQGLLYVAMKLFGVVASTADYEAAYLVDSTPFFIVGRGITAVFGVLTVWLTYLTTRKITSAPIAFAAACLLAVNAAHIAKSQAVEVDVPMTCFIMLFFWNAVCALEQHSRKNCLLMGLAMGLAMSTKYTAALLVIPLFVLHLFGMSQRQSDKFNRGAKARSSRHAWTSFALALAVATVAFALTSPFVFLDASTFMANLGIERQHMAFGHFGLDRSSSSLFYLQALGTRLLGWPLTVAALIGMVYITAFRRPTWAIVFASFAIPYSAAIASWSMRADRYILPLVPIALIFVGALLSEGLRLPQARIRSEKAGLAAVTVVTVLLAMPLAAYYVGHLNNLNPDTRTLAKRWIEANVPSGAFVATEAYGPALFGPHDVISVRPEVRERILEIKSATPQYAVQPIPMFQVNPERSELFYDPPLYEMADVMIITSAVRDRYVRDRSRFAAQAKFYDDLQSRFVELKVFRPQAGPGPTVILYRNPRQQIPFGGRRVVSEAPDLRAQTRGFVNSEDLFFQNLGTNYEAFGYAEQALACYERVFNRYLGRPGVYIRAALGVARCHLMLERTEEAIEFLERAVVNAPNAKDRSQLQRLHERLSTGGRRP